jgi:L-iditol 2-dehydrogenase
MKAVALTGVKQCELVDKPVPVAKEDLVVVKILSAPMCTEYKGYREGWQWDALGHEAAGEVVEVAQPGAVEKGDRVVVMPQYPCGKCPLCLAGEYIHCQQCIEPLAVTGSEYGTATYAQYILKQDWLLVPIPDDMSYDHAAMACCGLGPTFGACRIMSVNAYDTVLITGLGPVGLGGVINVTYSGACVIGIESNPYRAALAKKLGAVVVLDPADDTIREKIMEMTNGLGIDKAIDCSGVPAAQRLAIAVARCKGQVTFVGEGGDLTIAVSDDMIRKGIALHGAWHYNLADTPLIMKVIRESTDKLDMLITHTFPMRRVRDAWELQLTGQCGKVILHPWE